MKGLLGRVRYCHLILHDQSDRRLDRESGGDGDVSAAQEFRPRGGVLLTVANGKLLAMAHKVRPRRTRHFRRTCGIVCRSETAGRATTPSVGLDTDLHVRARRSGSKQESAGGFPASLGIAWYSAVPRLRLG